MKVSDIGEFGLIERLEELLASHSSAVFSNRLAVGIGDDAAVWKSGRSAIVATTDTLVAGVHFLPERTGPGDLGWKALAVNVSDVAAMGAEPEFALVTIALPESFPVEEIDALYGGLAEAAEAYGVVIAGGDIVRSPTLTVTVALVGRARLDSAGEPLVLRRNAARPGDAVAVTGALGGAAGGLALLAREASPPQAARGLIERHRRPQARLQAGQSALRAGLRCAIDISDGLLQDLGHICRASGVGAVVWRDRLPLPAGLSELVGAEEAVRLAATGGEDYELLLVGPREQIDRARRRVGVALTEIGEIVIDRRQEATLLDESGRALELPSRGWDHLKAQA